MPSLKPRPRVLAWAGAATALCLVAAGCGGDSDTKPSALNTDGPAPTGVTLTMWHTSADPQALLDLIDRYEEASGNTIEFVDIPADTFDSTVPSKWATGDRPDILEFHGLQTFFRQLNPEKNLIELTDMPFVEKAGDLSNVIGNLDGKVYAASIGFPQIFGYYYNKDVFAEAGLEPPQDYDEVLAACETLKAEVPDVAPVYSAAGSVWPTGINVLDYMASYQADDAYAQAIVSGEAKFTDEDGPFLKAASIDPTLRENGCFNEDTATAKFEDSMKALLEGEAAMVGQHSDMVEILNTLADGDTDRVDDTIGFVGIAAEGPTASYAPNPLGTYYVPSTGDATKERAAIDFISWITGEGYAQYVEESKAPPVLSGVPTPEMQGLRQDIAKAWENDPALFFSSNVPGVGAILVQETAKLVIGQTTPEEVAKKLQVAYEQAAATE